MRHSPVFHWAVVILLIVAFAGTGRGEERPDVVRVLHAWERASAAQANAAFASDFREYRDSHTSHELQVAVELSGPVSARALITRYSWTCRTDAAGMIVLTGVPRDALSRLFCAGFTVEIDPETSAPRSLRFLNGRQPRPVAILLASTPEDAGREPPLLDVEASEIRLASAIEVPQRAARGGGSRIEMLLGRWEAATRQIRNAEIHFTRSAYDRAGNVEERGEGRFCFAAPNRGLYELRPAAVGPAGRSETVSTDGRPIVVKPARPLILSWDQDRVIVAHPGERVYDELAIPRAFGRVQQAGSFDRLWYSLASPQRALPATIDVHSEQFLERFHWSLLEEDDRRWLLLGRPIGEVDRLEVSELQVVLDPQTHLAQATRVVLGDGSRELVHVLRYVVLNDDGIDGSEWRPDLTGYAEFAASPPAPPAELDIAVPPAD